MVFTETMVNICSTRPLPNTRHSSTHMGTRNEGCDAGSGAPSLSSGATHSTSENGCTANRDCSTRSRSAITDSTNGSAHASRTHPGRHRPSHDAGLSHPPGSTLSTSVTRHSGSVLGVAPAGQNRAARGEMVTPAASTRPLMVFACSDVPGGGASGWSVLW